MTPDNPVEEPSMKQGELVEKVDELIRIARENECAAHFGRLHACEDLDAARETVVSGLAELEEANRVLREALIRARPHVAASRRPHDTARQRYELLTDIDATLTASGEQPEGQS